MTTKTNYFTLNKHGLYMLKMSKATIIHDSQKGMFNLHYDHNTEIYRYDERHIEFLKAISLITYNFEELENALQEYYTFTFSSDYIIDIAKDRLKTIKKTFEKIHILLRSQDLALLHIEQVLYEYFCKMTRQRFLDFLSNYENDNLILSQVLIEDFYEQDKKNLNNLFLPLLQLYDELYWENVIPDTYESLSQIRKNFLNDNSLNTWISFLMRDGKKISQIKKSKPQLNNKKECILSRYQIIVDVFTDYFSVFSSIQDEYPQIKSFHQYALILSNKYLYSQLIDECNFYSPHQSMYKIIDTYLARNAKILYITLSERFIGAQTNDIYQTIKDSLNANETTKEQIAQELLEYYPESLEDNMNAEIIEFQCFEQLIAIELLDIIAQNKIIKKCPYCNCYFITSSKKQKYCDQHKNNPRIRQEMNNKNKDKLLQIYQKYYNRIHQRICRADNNDTKKDLKNKFEKWSREAQKLISNEAAELSEEEFSKKLDDLFSKNGILGCYQHTKHKKNTRSGLSN